MDFKKLTKPYQNDLIKAVERLVAIPSVYDEKTSSPSKPFGKNVDEALKAFAKFGKDNGFKVETNKEYVELSLGNKGPVIGIYGHLDVVPSNKDIFKVKKVNNKLLGRGVADDKGPLLAALYGVIALKNKGLIKNAQIKVFAGGNEERGSSCLQGYAKTHKAPKFGFTPDSNFPVIYGEKGLIKMIMTRKLKFKNIIAINGGVAPNVVMGEVTFKVNNINQIKNKLKTPHKIKGNEITFFGQETHASTPELGKNAFLLALKELAKLNHDSFALKFAETFLDYTGKKLGAYYKSKSLGPTTFCVGLVNYKNNQLTMSVDCRRPENSKRQVIMDKVLKSYNFKLIEYDYTTPLLYDVKSPLISLLMDAYKKETGDYKNGPVSTGGGTYAKEIKNTVAFGPEYSDVNYFVHQDDEYIYINDLYKLMSIYAHAVYNLMNAKK